MNIILLLLLIAVNLSINTHTLVNGMAPSCDNDCSMCSETSCSGSTANAPNGCSYDNTMNSCNNAQPPDCSNDCSMCGDSMMCSGSTANAPNGCSYDNAMNSCNNAQPPD